MCVMYFLSFFFIVFLDVEYDVEFKIFVEENVGIDVNVYF